MKQFLVTAAILMMGSFFGIAHAQTFGVAFEVYGDDEPAVHRIQQAVANEFAQRHFRHLAAAVTELFAKRLPPGMF